MVTRMPSRERLGHAFQRELRRGVERVAGVADHTADRGHLHDVPAAAGPQVWQHGTSDGEHAEHVGLEDAPRLCVGQLLERADQPVTRVVDEHVDPPELPDRGVDRGTHRRGVGDVELDREGGQPGEFADMSGGGDHVVAGGEHRLGERTPETAVRAGDEPDLRH